MSEKTCKNHKNKRRKTLRRCCGSLIIFIFISLFTLLIVWAVLQPKKPRFLLQDATVFNLNISAPNVMSTTIQVTINSRNPNSRIGIYYDKMDVYATYQSQQITFYTSIPPVYQGHRDYNVWSPFITGRDVPIAPYNGIALSQDQSNGVINMMIKIDGRIRWKVGTIITGRYHIHITCLAYVPLGNSRNAGIVVGGNGIKYQLSQSCRVSI